MIDSVNCTVQIEQNKCSDTIGSTHEVVVYGGDCCFRRVESAIGRLSLGQQLVVIDVLHEPRGDDPLDQLRCESE